MMIQRLDNAGLNEKKRLENFLLAMDIDDHTRKRALLLHYIGPSAFDVFETLSDTGDEKDYKTAMERLTEHFTPQRNIEYEIYLFRQARQQPQETLDQFVTRLRQLASSCEFASVDKEIKSQIILSCSSSRLRRRALREPTIITLPIAFPVTTSVNKLRSKNHRHRKSFV